MAILFGGVLWRLVHLHHVQHRKLVKHSHAQAYRQSGTQPDRGMIIDRNGYPLAVSTQNFAVWMDPKFVNFEDPHWRLVQKILNISPEKWQAISNSKNTRFVYLSRDIAPSTQVELKALHLKGLYFSSVLKRFYPEGEALAPVIGITNVDGKGQEGLERKFNTWLSGEAGKMSWVQDVKGRKIEEYVPSVQGVTGKPIQLSIDKHIQHVVYQNLKAGILKHHAQAGSAVLVDVKTGEILAMASFPSINPNSDEGFSVEGLKNRAALDQFEPGSVMKPFAMAAVLASGQYTPEDTIDTSPGFVNIGGHIVRDGHNNGELTLSQIIQKSSNVGIGKLVTAIPETLFPDMLDKLGFGQLTGVPVFAESAGYFPRRKQWGPFGLATLSFGYGIAVTNLQLAQAYAALANGGKKIPLTLFKRDDIPKGEQVLDQKVAEEVVAMMEKVVGSGGTAYRARVDEVPIAGKTGTARKAIEGGYAEDQYIAVFVGILPADHPRYVMVTMVDDPRGSQYYGGSVAAPIFASSMKALRSVLSF